MPILPRDLAEEAKNQCRHLTRTQKYNLTRDEWASDDTALVIATIKALREVYNKLWTPQITQPAIPDSNKMCATTIRTDKITANNGNKQQDKHYGHNTQTTAALLTEATIPPIHRDIQVHPTTVRKHRRPQKHRNNQA